MRERPILFSAPMVRAILDGRKTQTRRVIHCMLNEIHELGHPRQLLGNWGLSYLDEFKDGMLSYHFQTDVDENQADSVRCPYGVPGDRLWVKEGFRAHRLGGDPDNPRFGARGSGVGVDYRASPGDGCNFDKPDWRDAFKHERWRSSLHMPRWASRITLEIEGVRVQRVQKIGEDDAVAEGCDPVPAHGKWAGPRADGGHWSARLAFSRLWDSINAKRPGCAWSDNPLVWAIAFKRVQP